MRITLNLDAFDFKKTMIESSIQFILDKVYSGNESALDARCLAVIMAKVSEGILADETLKQQAISETLRLGKDNVQNGVRYSIMEAGTKYDYSQSDAYKFQSANVKREADKLKEVETLAKTISEPATIEIYGNTLEVLPATKTSTTTVKIELL